MYCVFCQQSAESFLPFGLKHDVLTLRRVIGGGYRPNALCPTCFSLDRERSVFPFLLSHDWLISGAVNLLHVAPERQLAKMLNSHRDITHISTDIRPTGTTIMDLRQMAFRSDSFDAVICNHVLEHIDDDRAALSEVYRVLRPKRWAIPQVPISYSIQQTLEDNTIRTAQEREAAYGQTDHVRLYGLDYRGRLESAGFEVVVTSLRSKFGNEFIAHHSLIADEGIHMVVKLPSALT